MASHFSRRALYSPASRVTQKRARDNFLRTPLGRVITSLRNDHRAGVRESARLESAIADLQRNGLAGALSTLEGASLNGLVNDIVRYAKGNRGWGIEIRQFLRSMGTAGKVISAIVDAVGDHKPRRSTGDRDVDAARQLIEAFGFETLPPSARSEGTNVGRSLNAARKFLEEHGYQVMGPGEPIPAPPPVPTASGGGVSGGKPPVPGKGGSGEAGGGGTPPPSEGPSAGSGGPRDNWVEVDMGGRVQKFPRNHPIVTKGAVKSPQSSNVYSFQYDVDRWMLYITFDAEKSEGNATKRPGPIYSYSHFPPQKFLAFMAAGSKGGYVWDNVRVRGTVSGHQYDYRLIGVREGYVPRKAVLRPDGEWYEPRTMRVTHALTGKPRTLKSRRGLSPVGRRFTDFPGGQINRGTPNRGR